MPTPIRPPFYPIIYVRGYAMTQGEIDQTTADPFCGFNAGSTVFRASADLTESARKFIFESPVVRLGSDFGYRDVYDQGYDIGDNEWPGLPDVLERPPIIIFRYYDEASELFGHGQPPKIEAIAQRLGALILHVRDLLCARTNSGVSEDTFRCYLVAHSMGGLVCRALLQHPECDPNNARGYVDKFFTYATPHNGVDMARTNVPSWWSWRALSNFNRRRMASYLNLTSAFRVTGRVDWMPEDRFRTDRVFCLVGTDRADYEASKGGARGSRTFVGHGSDGLVRIENATLRGLRADGTPGEPCAKAFVFRSHSGYFGIVNSEESYQNLTGFLFGDLRVDVWSDVSSVTLPTLLEEQEQAGRAITALYRFEVLTSPRGESWCLTRRTSADDSSACFTHEEWKAAGSQQIRKHLCTAFLKRAIVDPGQPPFTFALTFGIDVPDYEIEHRLWFNEHYEGGALFRGTFVLEVTPPGDGRDAWQATYSLFGQERMPAQVEVNSQSGKVEIRIDFDTRSTPGLAGRLRFEVSEWNMIPSSPKGRVPRPAKKVVLRTRPP